MKFPIRNPKPEIRNFTLPTEDILSVKSIKVKKARFVRLMKFILL